VNSLFNLSTEKLHSWQIIDWGYTEEDIPLSLKYYDNWVKKNYHGPLIYMADERKEKRKSLSSFYPAFQSALVFLFDYKKAAKANQQNQNYQFAAYTKGFDGLDYHLWIKDKLDLIAKEIGITDYVLSIDAQPVLERDLAYRAGLGWFGKNSMLINQKEGSFFLISSILLPKKLNLARRSVATDHCGNCTRCLDACPTQAIVADRVVDAAKCISTFTIELFKDADAPKGYPTERGEIFGCDICQEVCPWNHKPLSTVTEQLHKVEFEKIFAQTDLENISNREFRRLFKHTSLERTGRVGFLKNLTKLKR
jgi:epoxyqueuosine reductase